MNREAIGGNNPPDMTVTAGDVSNELSAWMQERPCIQTESDAREAKVLLDRASLCIKDMDDERKAKVAPLREQVESINNRYRDPATILQRVLDELRNRVGAYLRAEGERRLAEARAAEQRARDAREQADAAARRETEAILEADAGVLGISVADQASETLTADRTAAKAEREAARAKEATHVKIGGGFRKALSLRTATVIHIDDHIAAIKDIGLTAGIELELRKAIKAYERLNGRYPTGVSISQEKY